MKTKTTGVKNSNYVYRVLGGDTAREIPEIKAKTNFSQGFHAKNQNRKRDS